MKSIEPKILFNMLEGYKPFTNLLGIGDPNVHKIDNQWWMFFSGFQKNFKNNVFSATLPIGEHLNREMKWTITSDPHHPKKALPLVQQPNKNEWDSCGLHEPCFVSGVKMNNRGQRVPCRRIYYTGRSTRSPLRNKRPFSIGLIELTTNGWKRYSRPIITGTEIAPNVCAPKVIFSNGKWHMWYAMTPEEPPKKNKPRYEVYYTQSENGINNWTNPKLFFTREDGFTHAYPLRTQKSYEMIVSRSGNLFGKSGYPQQNLWHLKASKLSGERTDWTREPMSIIEADKGDPWYQGGFFGSSICEGDSVTETRVRYVFFSSIHEPINWFSISIARLKTLKKPPVPAPFYFSLGFFRIDD
ncbi:hypothetical protein [Priestia filamentosa]|uniref:hypothetical protein n=1 Tax=Priestia filamentosa TaxID=1402861 RepID=UPI0002E82C13|nr:hypothetical protein [Priestia filamentosa]